MTDQFSIARRSLLKGARRARRRASASPGAGRRPHEAVAPAKPPLAPDQLDSWIAVNAGRRVVAFFGKMDMGQGVDVAIAQIVAEELDVPFERVSVVMGDTARTVNQGGASGSTGVAEGRHRRCATPPPRRAACSSRWRRSSSASPADRLDGHATASSRSPAIRAQDVSYGELIGGRYFNMPIELERQDRQRSRRQGQGEAEAARRSTRSSAQSPPALRHRRPRCSRELDYVTDIRVPGMLHGRMIRPPVAGAVPVAVDEGSVSDIPGVAGRARARASSASSPSGNGTRSARPQRLQVTWSEAAPPSPSRRQLYDHIRKAPVAQARGAGRERATSIRPSPAPRGSSRRSTNGRSSRMPAWARPAPSSMRRPTARRSGPARRSRISRATGSPALLGLPQDKVHGDLGPGPRLLWPQRCRRRRDRCGGAVEGGRAGRCASRACATKGMAGTPRGRPRSIAPAPRSTRMAR